MAAHDDGVDSVTQIVQYYAGFLDSLPPTEEKPVVLSRAEKQVRRMLAVEEKPAAMVDEMDVFALTEY